MNVFAFILLFSMFFFVTDGDRGPGNKTVDMQRNRVLATEALKNAEVLGNQSMLL